MSNLRHIFLCAALPTIFFSCVSEKEQMPEDMIPAAEEQTRIPTGFTASLPKPADKTTMLTAPDGVGYIIWQTGDPILASNGIDTLGLYVEEGGTTSAALYAKREPLEGNEFYAIYPLEGAEYASGIFTTVIPEEQQYVKDGLAPGVFPMFSICDDNRNFAFRNAASMLRIVVSSEDTLFKDSRIAAIKLSSRQALAGKEEIHYSYGGDPEVECNGSTEVRVSTDGRGIALGETINVVVAPGSYTSLMVTVLMQNGLIFRQVLDERLDLPRSRWKGIDITLADNYTDISVSQTANCYMITEPGSYCFNAGVRGNGVLTSACAEAGIAAAIEGGSYAKVYHSDGEEFLEGSFEYKNGYLYFTTKESLVPGAKLLSLQDEAGNTLWSWHVWCNPEIRDISLSNGSVWLNMNLGALKETFNSKGYNGFYYQWGRKDPFLQKYTSSASADVIAPFVSRASATDGSLLNSIQNPHTFYGGWHPSGVSDITEDWSTYEDTVKVYDWWNASYTADDQKDIAPAKTMFDPCPAGYHVPVYSEASALLEMSVSSWSGNGKTVDGKLFFPASSYRYINIYDKYWVTNEPRAFYQCATPMQTDGKHYRRAYRPYFTEGGKGIGNGARSYGLPVRCIKDGWVPVVIVDVTSVELDRTELSLVVGETAQLTATVLPEEATDPTVTWTSSDTSVATVNGGLVFAAGRGSAVITASSGNFSASCTVTVRPNESGVSGNPEDFDPEDWN